MAKNFKINYDGNDSIKKEIEDIRNSYLDKSDSQKELERLRKIDYKVKNIPIIISLSFGVVGTLLFGLGLTFILEFNNYIFGIIIGIIGIILMIFAYPIYNKIYNKLKNKYKTEILKLSDKLMNEIDA